MDAGQILTIKSETAYTIQSDQTAQETSRVFDAENIRALLVLDPQGKLTGVLSDYANSPLPRFSSCPLL